MKQIHAVLRLLVCLLLAIAWAKQPPPAFPGHGAGAAVTGGRIVQADAGSALDDAELSLLEITQLDGGSL